MRAERVLSLLLVSSFAGGCSGVCKGPGCVDEYDTARLAIFRWADPMPRTLDPWTDAETLFDGAPGDGVQWTVRPGPGSLFIGMPEANRVTRQPLNDGVLTGVPTLELTGIGSFGASVELLDVGGQTTRDVVVGAPDHSFSAGKVFVFLDAATGENGTLRSTDADIVIEGTSPSDQLGASIRVCADLTGDGKGELAITSPWLAVPKGREEEIPNLAGAVFVLESEKLATARGAQSPWDLGRVYWGDGEGDALGRSVICNQDLSGDRQPDLAFGAPYAGIGGQVSILPVDDEAEPGAFLPPSGPVGSVPGVRLLNSTTAGAWFGTSMTAADFDGVAPFELVVGAPGAQNGAGRVEIFQGPQLVAPDQPFPWRVIGNQSGRGEPDHLGHFVATADLGLADDRDTLLIGAPDWYGDGNLYDAGALYLWSGRNIEQFPALTVGSAEWKLLGTSPFQRVGDEVLVLPAEDSAQRILLLPTRTAPAR